MNYALGEKSGFPKNGNLLEATRNRDISSFSVVIPALSKESSGILFTPFCPSVLKKSLSLELRLHFKDLRNATLGSN